MGRLWPLHKPSDITPGLVGQGHNALVTLLYQLFQIQRFQHRVFHHLLQVLTINESWDRLFESGQMASAQMTWGNENLRLTKKNWDTTLLLPLTETKHGECTVWGWILLLPFQCLCPKHLKNEFAFSDRFPVSVVQKVPLLSNPLERNQLSSVLPQLLIKNFFGFAWRTKTSNRQHSANVHGCVWDNLQSNTWKQFINQEIRGLLMIQGCLKIQIPKNDLVNGDFL